MRSMLPLLAYQAKAQWADQVHVSDACLTGYGVCTRVLPLSEVQAVGRLSEKWRYRAQDMVNARAHALRPDVLSLDPESFQRLPDFGALHSSEGQQLLDEVPATWLNGGWTVSFRGR